MYSRSEEEHAHNGRTVLETLRSNKLYAKFSNCEFWLEQVALLGHYIPKEGVSMDHAKINAVSEWPTPKNVTDVRSFLGLAGYYRRFVKDFSKIARPMTTLMKKETKFVWDEKCELVFQTLKDQLTTALVLALPNGSEGFEVYSDASKHGLYHEGKANVVANALSRKSSHSVNALVVADDLCEDIKKLNL
ncbi:uncharacterized protein LOC110691289 [Chenopodium quinoa]|uniref:uncharacterized protein LOC110691289 n=1 Tax=Chenopodium quinoa TaxID=63459 RepID=UPI000B77CBEA|nr:uncharacterized protein LOC110691289 [Chenopodium quinoa]